MDGLTVERFNDLLKQASLEEVVDLYILSGPCSAYNRIPNQYNLLKRSIANSLGTSADNVFIVGSAKLGFSFNPDYYPRPFSWRSSDLDVMIIDSRLYNEIWVQITEWRYDLKNHIPTLDWQWFFPVLKNDVSFGWLNPLKFAPKTKTKLGKERPLKELRVKWNSAFQSLTIDRRIKIPKKGVTGLLYNSWEHARLRQTDRLERVKKTLDSEVT